MSRFATTATITETTGTVDVATMLHASGAVEAGFAGIQYDLNSTWRRLPSGEHVGAHLCDHNCTIEVLGVPSGGNYSCPASLSLNKGVSKKWLTPAEAILRSIGVLQDGIDRYRSFFFRTGFDDYCREFGIPAEAATAMRDALDRPGLEINLFGGNPEMHPEILTIIRELRAAGHRVHFTTTGRRLMRDQSFVEGLLSAPPSLIALSADDFDDADHIHRLADLSREKVVSEWRTVPWQHGQRQKACEAVYVAKLAQEMPGFPPLLFNMVLHPGNLANAYSIVAALTERFPNVIVNPYPVQSGFMADEEPGLRRAHAALLRDVVDEMIEVQAASARAGRKPAPHVARLHYWLMLRAVFDWAGDDHDTAMSTVTGDGIWRCYQRSAAGRYLQVGMGTPHQKRLFDDQHPGGFLGCFWNNETVTSDDAQVWDMDGEAVSRYVESGKPQQATASASPCRGCAFPRLTYDMLATETGMRTELVPFYREHRARTLGF